MPPDISRGDLPLIYCMLCFNLGLVIVVFVDLLPKLGVP